MEYDELLDILYKNTGWLSSLVIELLELTNQGKIEMSQQIDLREITDEILLDLEPLANQNKISIMVDGTAKIYGNDSLIQRMIFNLIQNAIRYNITNGIVCVKMTEERNKVVFTVADSGIGIPDEMKRQIFEPLFRVDQSRSRELGGNGLGIAIAKMIVQRHCASFAVENNTPQGTVFNIVFPANAV